MMMYGAEYEACHGTTLKMVDCLDARAAHWQAEMEKAFRALGLLSGDQADRLKAVQELWL